MTENSKNKSSLTSWYFWLLCAITIFMAITFYGKYRDASGTRCSDFTPTAMAEAIDYISDDTSELGKVVAGRVNAAELRLGRKLTDDDIRVAATAWLRATAKTCALHPEWQIKAATELSVMTLVDYIDRIH